MVCMMILRLLIIHWHLNDAKFVIPQVDRESILSVDSRLADLGNGWNTSCLHVFSRNPYSTWIPDKQTSGMTDFLSAFTRE